MDLTNEIKEVYDLATKLYYVVADDNMKRRGHPGVMGPSGSPDEEYTINYGTLVGAIRALDEVLQKIK